VQSHTTAHAVLSQESTDDQRRDLASARDELERRLGVNITTVAYPHGTAAHYDTCTLQAARDAGYRWGITTREGFSGPGTPALELRRCVMYPERGIVELLAQMRYLARGD
jgi:peptidoglycan/xylan/chitin deacetylase (PgdA/CDA1 family)